jgi:hypothetical protein
VIATTFLILQAFASNAQDQQAKDAKGSAKMPEVVVAEKPEVKVNAFEAKKFPNPEGIHQRYVNALIDAAVKAFPNNGDDNYRNKAEFSDILLTLAIDEKNSTDSRNTMIVERKAISVFDSYLEKMGPEATKEQIAKYATVRIPKFTELASVKKLGFEKDFNQVIVTSLNKGVDEEVAKEAQKKDVTISGSKKEISKTSSEQDGAGQPATRPESTSDGSDKPQPEAEGRSR